MKKIWILIILSFVLCGCSVQETFETVNDTVLQPQQVLAKQMILTLPEDAAVPAMESDMTGQLYLCDDYFITVQTALSGDLNATIKETTGFDRDMLSVIETTQGQIHRYECVWVAAGEEEQQVGRMAILDDGNYHYVVTVMADASKSGDLTDSWNQLLSSFSLADTAP